MKKSLLLSLCGAFVFGASVVSAQSTTRVIEITGTAAGSDLLQIGFVAPGTNPACDVYSDCIPHLIWCTLPVFCSTGDSAETLAANLAGSFSGICNGQVNPGFSAVASGSTLVITGPPTIDFECCLGANEHFSCGGAGNQSLLLDGCTINNVCNGVGCDETLPHVSGFTFAKCPPAVSVVTNPPASIGLITGNVNPLDYAPLAGPSIGGTYAGVVNCSKNHPLYLVVFYPGGTFGFGLAEPCPGTGQVVICDITQPQVASVGPNASGNVFSVSVPVQAGLCGTEFCSQAICIGGGQPFQLTNAVDHTAGS